MDYFENKSLLSELQFFHLCTHLQKQLLCYTDGIAGCVLKLCFQDKINSLMLLSSSVLITSALVLLFEILCLEFSSILFSSL